MVGNKILGLVVFAVGVALIVFAYNATQAPLEELTNTITGNYTDQTMWYFAGGVAAIVAGLFIILGGRR